MEPFEAEGTRRGGDAASCCSAGAGDASLTSIAYDCVGLVGYISCGRSKIRNVENWLIQMRGRLLAIGAMLSVCSLVGWDGASGGWALR